MKGFFNMEDLASGKYNANITVFYEDNNYTKLLNFYITEPEVPKKIPLTIIFIVVIVVVILLLIGIIIYLVFALRKNKKEKTKK